MPAHIVLFHDAKFHGPHKHVFDQEALLNFTLTDESGNVHPFDTEFYKSVSSFAILSGNWRFFPESNFGGTPFPVVLGPGLYSVLETYKLTNDGIGSLMSVSDAPTVPGEPMNGHAILFQHANFHGDHRHVFRPEQNLDENDFNDLTSSIVIESGNWNFFRDSDYAGDYGDNAPAPVLGPGLYPWVEDVGIKDNDVSSLRISNSPPTVSNSVDNQVLLFDYGQFRGAHKHVFMAEEYLDAADDNSFNDHTSSIVVLAGTWSFFSDVAFVGPYPVTLNVGMFPLVTDQQIKDNEISSLRPFVSVPVIPGEPITGHVILFEDASFQGAHRHIFNQEDNLNANDDDDFNDAVSSIIVVSGNWKFYRNAGFNDDYPAILGPGLYDWVGNVGIRDNDVSSLKAVEQSANVRGEPFDNHVILFEHRDFRGDHRHIVRTTIDLTTNESSFPAYFPEPNISSLVVERGNWQVFRLGTTDLGPVLGPGIYPWVEDVGIGNDSGTSLETTDQPATVVPRPLQSHTILFEHENLRGTHKHVFAPESNLNAPDDDSFNDAVVSIAVLLDQWRTFRDWNFQLPYDVILSGGLYQRVTDVGMYANDMSSLEPAA